MVFLMNVLMLIIYRTRSSGRNSSQRKSKQQQLLQPEADPSQDDSRSLSTSGAGSSTSNLTNVSGASITSSSSSGLMVTPTPSSPPLTPSLVRNTAFSSHPHQQQQESSESSSTEKNMSANRSTTSSYLLPQPAESVGQFNLDSDDSSSTSSGDEDNAINSPDEQENIVRDSAVTSEKTTPYGSPPKTSEKTSPYGSPPKTISANTTSIGTQTEDISLLTQTPTPVIASVPTSASSAVPNPSFTCSLMSNQSTMWLGTEDGCIHVYNCSDNIRIKKNKIKIQLSSTVNSIVFSDNRVFAGLSNGQLVLFRRDEEVTGCWITSDPTLIDLSSSPVLQLLPVGNRLWCASQNYLKIFNTISMQVELMFEVDASRVIQCMVSSGLGVWVSTQSSTIIRLFHASSYECLLDIDVAPAVTKSLSGKYLFYDRLRKHQEECKVSYESCLQPLLLSCLILKFLFLFVSLNYAHTFMP